MTSDDLKLLLIGFVLGVGACAVVAGAMWFLAPKIRGLLTRVPLSTGELIGMRLRGTPVNLVIDAAISLRMQGHPFRSDTIALIEQVYLEDKRRHSDSRSLADAVAARASAD